jgi:hypothetical protein
MLLQHHYGQHLFGDDMAMGARVTVRVHRRIHRHRRLPHARQKPSMQRLAAELASEIGQAEEHMIDQLAVQVTNGAGAPCARDDLLLLSEPGCSSVTFSPTCKRPACL